MYPSLLIVGKNFSQRKEQAAVKAKLNSGNFDTIFLDATENPGIEETRRVVEKLKTKPFASSATTLVVLEAQNLTNEAQNFLLKTLEEPNETSQIILTSPTSFSIIPTVASRCQIINLGAFEINLNAKERALFEKIVSGTLGEKFEASENLDLDKWEAFWREQMLSFLNNPKLPLIIRYLRSLERAKDFLSKRASPKITKANLIFDIPKLD